MKVGNLVNGIAVVDVKRVNKMNIIQFTKAVSEYIDQGYKIDVNSARAIGLVLMVDMYKLEDSKKEVEVSVGKTEPIKDRTTDTSLEGAVIKPTQRSKKAT